MRDVDTSTALETEIEVESFGAQETGSFSIAVNGKAFDILMSGLYSRANEAIVRELCTNAFDAHLAAGCVDRPFRLQLPSRWDDRFAVRDYGTSLGHHSVMTLYTKVFQSTKDKTNAQVGKYGLGSKTPFAYTDQFTVTAWMDGEKRVYTAFRDAERIPKISLFAREVVDHSTEGNEVGLEVSFPVQPKDLGSFNDAARRVLMGFDVKPITRSDVVQELAPSFQAKDGSWKVYPSGNDLPLPDAPHVRQGCVIYPVDIQAVGRVANADDMKGLNAFAHEMIILDMPIGTVEVTPSRETLSYDPTTAQNLAVAFLGALQEIKEQATETLTDAPTLFDAIKKRGDVFGSMSSWGALRNEIMASLKWRGREVKDSITISGRTLTVMRRHGVDIRTPANGGKHGRAKSLLTYHSFPGSISVNPGHIDTLPVFFYWSGENAPLHLGYRYAAAVEQFRSRGHHYILPNFTPGGVAEAVLKVALGRPDTVTLVDLATVAFTRPDYKKTLAQVGEWDGFTKFRPTRFGQIQADDTNVWYVKTLRGEVVPPAGWAAISHGAMDFAWDTMREIGVIPRNAKLVNIPASRKDLSKDIPDAWNDLFEDTEEALQTLNIENAEKSYCAGHLGLMSAEPWGRLMTYFSTRPAGDIADPSSTMIVSISRHNDFKESLKGDYKRDAALKDLAEKLGRNQYIKDFDYSKCMNVFTNIKSELSRTYPMVDLLCSDGNFFYNWPHPSPTFARLVDYINLVDASRTLSAPTDVSIIDIAQAA